MVHRSEVTLPFLKCEIGPSVGQNEDQKRTQIVYSLFIMLLSASIHKYLPIPVSRAIRFYKRLHIYYVFMLGPEQIWFEPADKLSPALECYRVDFK